MGECTETLPTLSDISETFIAGEKVRKMTLKAWKDDDSLQILWLLPCQSWCH